MKLLFTPFSVVGGLIGGLLASRLFEKVWGWFDEEEAPDAKHRDAPWAKLLVAAALQGAIFRLVRAVIDRGARTGFMRLTGSWPGEPRPERES